jgi:hypothetical protein
VAVVVVVLWDGCDMELSELVVVCDCCMVDDG